MPSLPVTDDGSAGPLTEDLSSGSGDGEDITWDAETAEAGGVPVAAGPSHATARAAAGLGWRGRTPRLRSASRAGGDVLGSQPRVDIECVLDSAATKRSEGTVLVQLFDGQRQIAAQTMAVTA
ncbi:MAG TPA: hypothetical protein VHS30_30390, partial [Streptosporangiaceae bacterium]|nr:hypothetical protein [Streptosporangiaceae bacterium]